MDRERLSSSWWVDAVSGLFFVCNGSPSNTTKQILYLTFPLLSCLRKWAYDAIRERSRPRQVLARKFLAIPWNDTLPLICHAERSISLLQVEKTLQPRNVIPLCAQDDIIGRKHITLGRSRGMAGSPVPSSSRRSSTGNGTVPLIACGMNPAEISGQATRRREHFQHWRLQEIIQEGSWYSVLRRNRVRRSGAPRGLDISSHRMAQFEIVELEDCQVTWLKEFDRQTRDPGGKSLIFELTYKVPIDQKDEVCAVAHHNQTIDFPRTDGCGVRPWDQFVPSFRPLLQMGAGPVIWR